MGVFDFMKRKPEIRADTVTPEISSDTLLKALLDKTSMTKEKALEIPTVQACVTLMANTISRLPLQLLQKTEAGDIKVIEDDPRVSLLNDDTGDTLTAKMFWRAMIEDYFLGKGGFAYVNRALNDHVISVHYVDEKDVSIGYQNFDPIFKEYNLIVQGRMYMPCSFIKILRKTHDGMQSRSIIDENPLALNIAYTEMAFELNNAKKGGMKRGYLEAEKPLTQENVNRLREGFRKLYGESDENVVILNNGIKFREASATSTELQMNENKESNAQEICKLFGIPASLINGSQTGNSMTDNDMNQFIRSCVAVMTDIECSLNRDFLESEEKGRYFWQFDTKELTRGSIKERYEAYKIGLEKNFLQIDEVRAKEGMEPLGIDWLQLNLNTVFYNPETKEIYTPNTNASMNLESGEGASTGTVTESEPAQEPTPDESRASKKNVIVVGPPGSGKTTWVQSQLKDGDIVMDMDKIRTALIGTGEEHQNRPDLVHMMSMIRWAVFKSVEQGDVKGRAYLITSEARRYILDDWQKQLNAELHIMDATAEECKARVDNDPNREDKELMHDLIDQWFELWEEGETDESGTKS